MLYWYTLYLYVYMLITRYRKGATPFDVAVATHAYYVRVLHWGTYARVAMTPTTIWTESWKWVLREAPHNKAYWRKQPSATLEALLVNARPLVRYYQSCILLSAVFWLIFFIFMFALLAHLVF